MTQNKRKTGKRKLSRFGRAVFIGIEAVLMVSILFFSWRIYTILQGYHQGDSVYEDLTVYTEAGRTDLPAAEDNGIDFAALAEINPDIVAWITLEDSMINYPVVQGTDNAYYLEHLFNREVNHMGCVFMDYRSRPDFSDFVTPLYAHHSSNGAMFAGIEKYKRQDFYETHKSFTLRTPEGEYLLEPYTGLVLDAAEAFLRIDFTDVNDFVSYANMFNGQSTFRSDITIGEDDRVAVLLTCTADFDTARYVLYCRLSKVR